MPRRRSEILALKQDLAAPVVRLLKGWEQHSAAQRIGDEQPRVSDLRLGRLDRFSVMRLMTFLARLGQDVEIRVLPAPWPLGERRPRGRFIVIDDAR